MPCSTQRNRKLTSIGASTTSYNHPAARHDTSLLSHYFLFTTCPVSVPSLRPVTQGALIRCPEVDSPLIALEGNDPVTYKRLIQRVAAPAVALAAIVGGGLAAAPTASAANTDCPDFYICIFENSNYTGRWIGVHQGYDNPNVGDFMNDRTTSIINNTNEQYRLFTDSNYRGSVFVSGYRTQVSNVGPDWNDRITSFRRTIWSDLT